MSGHKVTSKLAILQRPALSVQLGNFKAICILSLILKPKKKSLRQSFSIKLPPYNYCIDITNCDPKNRPALFP